jgi:hypothetical protein
MCVLEFLRHEDVNRRADDLTLRILHKLLEIFADIQKFHCPPIHKCPYIESILIKQKLLIHNLESLIILKEMCTLPDEEVILVN